MYDKRVLRVFGHLKIGFPFQRYLSLATVKIVAVGQRRTGVDPHTAAIGQGDDGLLSIGSGDGDPIVPRQLIGCDEIDQ